MSSAAISTGVRRNPGPSWGYQFLRITDRLLPEFIYRPLRAIGTAIAMVGMPAERAHSREYLQLVLGRMPTLRDVFRHFFTFEEALMLRLRIINGRHVPCTYADPRCGFAEWMSGGGPVLLGTMHVGVSDMLGFQLAGRNPLPVYMVRQRVGNAPDVDTLSARFGDRLRIIWVNNPDEIPFALKEAATHEGAIALQCDRAEFCSRTATFPFLGRPRVFPFTIYHLALIFDRPVIFSFGVPDGPAATRLYSSPLFRRHSGETRAAYLARAEEHFRQFLVLLETTLRAQPYLWFNFIPFNPPECARDA